MRKVVDFPQPEGPTSTVKLPSGIVSERSGITGGFPSYDFDT